MKEYTLNFLYKITNYDWYAERLFPVRNQVSESNNQFLFEKEG